MIRLLLAALLFLAPMIAMAQGVNPCTDIAGATVGKTSEESLALIKACRSAEPAKVEVPRSIIPDPGTASKWAEASKGFAQALGIAAKELNIAANDFLDSPAGILLAAVLVWNYAGDSVMNVFSVFVAIGLTFFLITFWWYTNRRMQLKSVEFEYVPALWGAITRKRVKSRTWRWEDNEQMYTIFSGVALLIMLIVTWIAST